MIDLGLNQYKIKEIKYEVKEGKTVIFKLNNFNLEDVEIVEKERVCCDKSCTCHTTKTVYDGNVEDKTYATDRQIIDEHIEAENKKIKSRFDALALDKSKELINKIKDVPYKVMEKVGTLYTFDDGAAQYETEEDPYIANDERERKKQKTILDAEKNEEEEVKFSLKDLDKYGPKKHLDDYEPISCLRSEKGMQEALESSRKKEWKEDVIAKPSKPTPTGNALVPIDFSVKEEQPKKPISLKERDEAGLKSIINAFKEGDKEENKE